MPQIINIKESEYKKMTAEKLRAKYLKKTPKGYSKSEIQSMPDDYLLEMAYFLSEGSEHSHSNKEPDVIYNIIRDNPNEFWEEMEKHNLSF